MKAADLINKLAALDPECNVYIQSEEDCGWHRVDDVDEYQSDTEDPYGMAVIRARGG